MNGCFRNEGLKRMILPESKDDHRPYERIWHYYCFDICSERRKRHIDGQTRQYNNNVS